MRGSPVGGAATNSSDSATRGDAQLNRLFRHETADVDGVRMHYVVGGTGEPLVLLRGWPQSWYACREIMPALATSELIAFFAGRPADRQFVAGSPGTVNRGFHGSSGSVGYSVDGASPVVGQRAWYGSLSNSTRSPRP